MSLPLCDFAAALGEPVPDTDVVEYLTGLLLDGGASGRDIEDALGGFFPAFGELGETEVRVGDLL